MSERLTIAFADAQGRIQGFAVAGAGALLWLAGEVSAVAAPPTLDQEPESWTISSPGSFELTLGPWGRAAPLAAGGGALIAACRASGTVGGDDLDGLAIVSRRPSEHAGALTLERSLSIFLGPELCLALAARRPRGAKGHDSEQLEAVAFRGEPLEPAAIERPRLSSTYDAAGLLVHAGLELWESEESEVALRIGGETVAHGELAEPGGAATRVAFVAWHQDGHGGFGSYAITTSA